MCVLKSEVHIPNLPITYKWIGQTFKKNEINKKFTQNFDWKSLYKQTSQEPLLQIRM